MKGSQKIIRKVDNSEKDNRLGQNFLPPEHLGLVERDFPLFCVSYGRQWSTQFLAALQPYKSPCPPLEWEEEEESQNFKSILSLVIKTKLVQNVNRMSERQKNRPTDSLTDRQTDRQTERQIEDKTTFQLSYQNKTCSEC